MSALRRKARKMTLVATSEGLESFRVDGSVDGHPVSATWNGRAVLLTELLYERARLLVAVDDVFIDAGMSAGPHPATLCGSPADVALTLARSCDVIEMVEYTHRGHQRSVKPWVL